jgi:hypothetical protein
VTAGIEILNKNTNGIDRQAMDTAKKRYKLMQKEIK